jgi:hypothetical protein
LLATVVDGPLDDDVAAWLIAGANGNPLALTELPGELREGNLPGRPRLPERFPVGALLRQRFLRQVNALPRTRGRCCWPPPTRPAIRRCCGGPPRCSA